MTYRIARCAAVAAALIVSGGIGNAHAQVAAANLNIDVVGAMKQLSHWVSAGWNIWNTHQKTLVAQAIPRVTEDLLKLAAQKKAVASDIQELINIDRPSEAGGMPASKTRMAFIDKAQSDAEQLNVILGTLGNDIKRMDPQWAFTHPTVEGSLMEVDQGYGTVTLKIGQFTSELSELGGQRAEDIEGMKEMIKYLQGEAAMLSDIANRIAAVPDQAS